MGPRPPPPFASSFALFAPLGLVGPLGCGSGVRPPALDPVAAGAGLPAGPPSSGGGAMAPDWAPRGTPSAGGARAGRPPPPGRPAGPAARVRAASGQLRVAVLGRRDPGSRPDVRQPRERRRHLVVGHLPSPPT